MDRSVSPWFYGPLFAVVFIAAIVSYFYRVQISDWWFLRGYEPDNQTLRLVEEAGLTDRARALLYRADPQLANRESLTDICGKDSHIGCILPGPKIYLLDYNKSNEVEAAQAQVTMVHEMLHLAYFRMSEEERQRIDDLIVEEMELVADKNVLARIDTYPKASRPDEAHSILATEVSRLSILLDDYYSRYFIDERQGILKAFELSKKLLQ